MTYAIDYIRSHIYMPHHGPISNAASFVLLVSRLTVVSRDTKKKQHVRASSGPRDHYSELFTRMAALKF